MSIVKDGHKATLRKWHEELQAKRGNRASLRRSTTVNDVCLSEGFRSLLMQTHTLWKIEAQEWRFTALALVAAVAANVKAIDERQPFAAQLAAVMIEQVVALLAPAENIVCQRDKIDGTV